MVSQEEIKNWYNNRHINLKEHAWRPYEAFPLMLDYIKPEKGKKILDVGCGSGYLLKAASNQGLETYGIDISEEGVKVAQRISPNSHIQVCSGEDIKFEDETFDYIISIGVIEHFLDINKGVSEMKRVAKKDAKLCIIVPNINFLLWKLKKQKGTEQQDINETLLSLKQWKRIFEKQGLKIESIHQDKWFARGSLKNRIFWKFLPLKYTYQFIFILRKTN